MFNARLFRKGAKQKQRQQYVENIIYWDKKLNRNGANSLAEISFQKFCNKKKKKNTQNSKKALKKYNSRLLQNDRVFDLKTI